MMFGFVELLSLRTLDFIAQVGSAFWIYVIGCFVSLVIGLLEIVTHKIRGRFNLPDGEKDVISVSSQ